MKQTKTYRERVLKKFDKKFICRQDGVEDYIAEGQSAKRFVSRVIDTTISEVLDDVELIVIGYIGDKEERKCARNRLAEIKKGLK